MLPAILSALAIVVAAGFGLLGVLSSRAGRTNRVERLLTLADRMPNRDTKRRLEARAAYEADRLVSDLESRRPIAAIRTVGYVAVPLMLAFVFVAGPDAREIIGGSLIDLSLTYQNVFDISRREAWIVTAVALAILLILYTVAVMMGLWGLRLIWSKLGPLLASRTTPWVASKVRSIWKRRPTRKAGGSPGA